MIRLVRTALFSAVHPDGLIARTYPRNRLPSQIYLGSPNYLSTKSDVFQDFNHHLKGYSSQRKLARKVIQEVYQKLSRKLPTYCLIRHEKLWKATLRVQWPEAFSFEGTGKNKKDAQEQAAQLALIELEKQKIVSVNGELLVRINIQKSPSQNYSLEAIANGPILPENFPVTHEDILELQLNFPDYKSRFLNCFEKVASHLKDPNLCAKPAFIRCVNCDGHKKWKATYNLKWPEPMTFSGIGSTRAEAEKWSILFALRWLINQGSIHSDGYPILYTKEELANFNSSLKAPTPIHLTEDILCDLEELARDFKALKPLLEEDEVNCQSHKENQINDPAPAEKMVFVDPLIGYTRKPMSPSQLVFRNEDLLLNHRQRIKNGIGNPAPLPIKEKRRELLDMIAANRVVVLSGDTGCGKSTQVPQFLLDSWSEAGCGAQCNIIVTQPRRLAAISLAQTVARDLGEPVGERIGYQVRLNASLPKQRGGCAVFCSVGILLKRLQVSPHLDGVSHLIIDEVHERDVLTDFLLVIIKDLLKTNSSLKVILMSASLNTDLLSRYFDNAPLFHINGRTFPVERIYLPDIMRDLQTQPRFLPDDYTTLKDDSRPFIDLNLILQIIRYIDIEKPTQGAILCFLPGWQEIKTLLYKLKEFYPSDATHWIIPLHSRLSHTDQQRVFERPPEGVRKIILTTNIAETSLTINDVVYVIDPGVHKELRFNPNRGSITMENHWISQSNVQQRAGRAGRVQPGQCFHLFSRKMFEHFEPFPKAEIHRIPLEKVLLDIKAYDENMKAAEFLNQALEPPSTLSIQSALKELRTIEAIDDSERLTHLGRRIAQFSTHPRLAKALTYSTILGCVSPVTSVVAGLSSSREAWEIAIDQKEQQRAAKRLLHPTSDHLALANLMLHFSQLTGKQQVKAFCLETGTNPKALHFIKGVRSLLANHLREAFLLSEATDATDSQHACNAFSNNEELIKMALLMGLGDKVLTIQRGRHSKGIIKVDEVVVYNQNKELVVLLSDSVNHSQPIKSRHLIYSNGVYLPERRKFGVRDTSQIAPITALLAAGSETLVNDHRENSIVLKVDNSNQLSFTCSPREAELLVALRSNLKITCHYLLRTIGIRPLDDLAFSVSDYHRRQMELLSRILHSPSTDS